MFSKLLVFVLVTVAFARPDVSHLKKVEYKAPITSYDVPVSSVDNKYATLTYNRYGQQNVPTVTVLPPLVYQTSGNVLPTLVANSETGQYGLLGQYGGQGYYYGSGGSSGSNNQGINFLTQLGQGGGQQGTHYVIQSGQDGNQQGAHFVSQQGQGLGQGAHFVIQQGQGGGQQGAHFITQQGQGAGQGVVTTQFVTQPVQHEVVSTQFVSQPVQHEVVNTQFVSQPVQHEVVNTQFVSQPVIGSGQSFNTHFVSQGQDVGHIDVVHGAGVDHQQQYVKDEERVYYFSAPDEIQHKTHLRINVVPTHTKKTNVIFVNAPSSPEVIPEVVVPPHQVIEDKTKVVVLVKEHDQFVPISVPAPLPVTQGKAEVFVVKYQDKHDAERILAGTGKVLGSTLVQQNKPSFVNSLAANVKNYGVSSVSSTVVPTLQQGSFVTNAGTGSKVVNIKESSGNVYGGSGTTNSYGTQSFVVSTTPATFTVGNVNSGLVGSTTGGKQVNAYEIKTVESVKNNPTLATFEIKNVGGNSGVINSQGGGGTYEYQTIGSTNPAGLNVRFDGSADGSNQGYTVQTTKFIQNVPNSESLGYDNIEQIRKLLGQSGQGIELVSISKGTLEGSAAGPQNQEAFYKSLGLNSESFNLASSAIPQDANTFLRTLEVHKGVNSVADLPLQSRSSDVIFDGPKQIQVGNDVVDVLSGSSLSS